MENGTSRRSSGVRANRAAVLAAVMRAAPVTRGAIASATGLSGPTVTRTVDALIRDGLVTELDSPATNARGRPATLLDVVADRAYAAGLDMGASNTRLVVVDLIGRPVVVKRIATPTDLPAEALADWVSGFTKEALGARWDAVGCIGLGLPGAFDPTKVAVSNAPHLPAVEGTAFLNQARRSFGKDMAVDNDANFALLGERYFGAAKGASNCVMFTLGAGLGAAVSIDGRLVRGVHGLVGEFGSLPLGPMGLRLEHLVTGPGLMFRASELGIHVASPADIFRDDASPGVATLRAQFEDSLGVALIAAVVSSDPEIIVLGGGIAPSLRGSIPKLRERLRRHLRVAPEIVLAELGDVCGALGAAIEASHRTYRAMGIRGADLVRLPSARPDWRDALSVALCH